MKIDFSKTSHIVFFAALLPLLSLAMAWAFSQVVKNPPFWLETFSPLASYTLLYAIFDRYLWHFKVFKFLGVVTFPDLRGRWKGKLKSSYNNETPQTYLEITQRFSCIYIHAYFRASRSASVVASFTELNGKEYLFYTYDNEPNSLKKGTMQNHKGTVKIDCSSKDKKLNGFYFNSIGNQGDIELAFEQKDLKCCF